ncbi:ATP-binding cassette, subfamily B [Micromonospora pattaloongensis]|uniref:ATP-binding cassette, subfamily B n=1 Tax=Micromonospora pattaloongensis TaxID=405436 RepID=A0A1H3NT47_9ACTN|nr:ABC transporter ATP-binding protein [Micromonospora pattaloongensis]SDY91933.1 ATP-binding cassette, subfamily B [Micromonospora pattaloongensis]
MTVAARSRPLLWQAVRHGGGWLPVLAAAALLGAAAELLLPAVVGLAVDAALRGQGPRWPVVAAGLLALIVVTDALGDLAAGSATARATARVRSRLLGHVLALPPRAAARRPVGDLVARLVGQAADAGNAGVTVVLGVAALLPSAGGVVALGLLDPLLGLTFLGGLLLLAVLMRAFVTDASAAFAGYQHTQGVIAGRLLEALTGSRTIAAAGTLSAEIARVLAPLRRLRAHGERTWHALARAATRSAALAPLTQLAVLAVGGWSVAHGRLTPGQLLAAIQYAALGAGLGAVVATLNRLVRARAGAARVAEILAEPPQRHGGATLPAGPGQLSLRNVSVRDDDGAPILDGIGLHVPGGWAVAVVGASGAGKSTLAAVAGRLRDPDDGEVLLDGIPLPRLSRAGLRRAVGYGFERPVLVGDTIADAIGLGARNGPLLSLSAAERTLPTIRRAARTAAVDGYVERLPDGYRTRLADAPMSGGEAQRLGLARALRAERLLILDDATSSVDTVTEHRIARAVAAHADGRTRLIVTHRAATAAAADLVAWLDAGRLRALATHRELWADPDYRAVFASATEPAGDPR